MSRIWAVARQMIRVGLRMKIALVFLVLLGLVVLGLPFSIAGDSSLTGAVQSFMSYALTATSVLLSLLTIFMSRSLSDEFVNRQIFLTMTKPIPRWQFLVGKWMGMMVLNLIFLTFSGGAIYGMVRYLRATHPPIDDRFDRNELEHDVLVARHGLRCDVPDFTKAAEAEFDRNVEQGVYDNVASLGEFNPTEQKRRLASKLVARWRVVGPLGMRVFEFHNVLCERSSDKEVQIRYKADVSQYPPDEIFRAVWQFGDPLKGTPVYTRRTRHVVGRYHTIHVPADAVAQDHTLTARFYNTNPFEGERQAHNVIEFRKANEVEVLFVVGSFEWNLVRLIILISCKLMFLAAVALLAATVFSFPVACLASFTVYVLAASRGFLLEAFDFSSDDTASMFDSAYGFFTQAVFHIYNIIHWVVPDFGRYDAVETFVNGRNVGLVWVLQGVAELVVLKTTLILGLAILLFYRREVAEVSA